MLHNRITLRCECTITPKGDSISRTAKFPCPNNLGHGYRIPWVTYVSSRTPNYTHTNPTTPTGAPRD